MAETGGGLMDDVYISEPPGVFRHPRDWAERIAWQKGSFQRRFVDGGRLVRKTRISEDVKVSTMFVVHDHRMDEEGPPILFETKIFGGVNDDYTDRYASYLEALDGHAAACALAKSGRRPTEED
jgi:hypothetical protein